MLKLLFEADGRLCPRFMGAERADSTGRNVLTAGPPVSFRGFAQGEYWFYS